MSQPTRVLSSDRARSAKMRRGVLFASAVGNFVEWFDFTLYGYTAGVIALTFFPPGNQTAALLGAFAVYGVAFVARPLGAVVFGRIGDRRGRRVALGWSIIVMGAATALMGLLPGWSSVGVLAPVLLLVCRLVQGFSAGGEYTGAMTFTVEHAPDGRRAWYTGLVGSSTMLGAVGATAVALVFRSVFGDRFAAEGWRWMFVLAGLVALAGLVLRLRVDESPVFEEMRNRAGDVPPRPFRDLWRGHRRTLLVLFAYFAVLGLITHMFLGYLPTYLNAAIGMRATTVLALTTAANVVSIPVSLCLCVLADRHGRRIQIRLGALAAVLLVVPAYLLMGTGSLVAVVVALLVFVFAVSLLQIGALSVLELYPTGVRFSGMALPYNVAYAIFGGTAPLVSELLVNGTGTLLAPAVYASVVALIALPILVKGFPETKGADLRS
ncbi:MFS transporter, MHS family, proline/betaine transporter [Amycolatopsis pretoriensis]|uniref:MFS transporter, MHS family, proline/betaine transporter n=1 Tax=Amycolatopsis pretoriensis TaxID=218821 RepID=A0A1H5RIR8_9PSEU|nr:MFS transporter [Amycolatopsis pretoriensis]SEF38252.1 MFS transporter, MHS family, proline/betaine transporter [Amycolatopsis pretoriensis]